jgi:hypothetical protein
MTLLGIPGPAFAACDPDLRRLPQTVTVRVPISQRRAIMGVSGIILVATPFLMLVALAWILTGHGAEGSPHGFELALMYFGVFMGLIGLPVGVNIFVQGWRARDWQREIIFGTDGVNVTDTKNGKTAQWADEYRAFRGIILRVSADEIPRNITQYIELRHGDAAKTIALHESKGNGLGGDVQDMARNWARLFGVPAFVENTDRSLVPMSGEA